MAVAAADFNGKQVQEIANCAYGTEIGITNTGACTYATGCSLSSAATDARRASSTVKFTANVTPAKKEAATTKSKAISKTSFTAAMTKAQTDLGSAYASVSLPTVSTVAAPTITEPTTSGASSTGFSMLTALVVLGATLRLQ